MLTFGGHLHDGHDRTGKHGAIAAAFADIDPPIIIFFEVSLVTPHKSSSIVFLSGLRSLCLVPQVLVVVLLGLNGAAPVVLARLLIFVNTCHRGFEMNVLPRFFVIFK